MTRSEACNRPFPIYRGYIIDRLIERGISGPRLERLLSIHDERIVRHFAAGFAPEMCVQTLAEMDAVLQQSAPRPSEAAEAGEESKAMQDTMRFLQSARKHGYIL